MTLGAVLATGGAGYVGCHLAKLLGCAGRRVVIYDNLSAGHRRTALGADLVEGDVRDISLLRDVMRRHGITAVMHFAAWPSVGDSVHDPAGYYGNSVGSMLALLEAMVGESIRHFVFSSTAGVDWGVYNPGNGEPHSVRRVIDVVSRGTGRQVAW